MKRIRNFVSKHYELVEGVCMLLWLATALTISSSGMFWFYG